MLCIAASQPPVVQLSTLAVLTGWLSQSAAAGADWWEAWGETTVPLLPTDTVMDAVLRDLLIPPRATNICRALLLHNHLPFS
jgi:hypothetical protein